jgi:hypothetical protein
MASLTILSSIIPPTPIFSSKTAVDTRQFGESETE